MKILQITNKYPFPANDGGNLAVTAFTRGFVDLGHSVDVLAISTYKHPENKSAIPELLRSSVEIEAIEVDTRIKLADLAKNLLFSTMPYNAVRFISKSFEQAIIQKLQTKKYDVIQLEGLYVCPYIKTIKKYSNALISLRAHNVESEIWKRQYQTTKNFIKKIYLQTLWRRMERFEKEMIKECEVLIPITERDSSTLSSYGFNGQMKVIPFGLDLRFADNYPPKPTESKNIFFIGALDWEANIEGLKWFIDEVLPLIKQRIKPEYIVVAGRNAGETTKSLLKEGGLTYVGEVEDAYEFMISNGIMIAPLFIGGGMRVKLIEAMALGKVIVTTSIGAEGINCINNKHIIIADSASEYAERLIELWQHGEIKSEIGQNAKLLVEKDYNRSIGVNSLISFYKKNIR